MLYTMMSGNLAAFGPGCRFARLAAREKSMLRLTEIKLPLSHSGEDLRSAIRERLRLSAGELTGYTVFRRGYDARQKDRILFVYTLDVDTPREKEILERLATYAHVRAAPDTTYRLTAVAPPGLTTRPIVVGTGPCGYFAGLVLAQMGFRPLLLERGPAVRERAAATFGFWRKGAFVGEANVQFGEGGAGTFSDGKLYTQIRDPRFLGRKVLAELVTAGAPPEILYVSKPHIGTFKLAGVVEKLRQSILALGGEVRFQSRVVDLCIAGGAVTGVELEGGERLDSRHVILAVGHSARDTFGMLHARGVAMEPKAFSIGLRIEHPQALIDERRLGPHAGNPLLGAADYKLVHHCRNGRTVYSFCMCPGGKVVAATSEAGCVVTNGMSQYTRAEPNANSAIVVDISPQDYPGGPLAGIAFQQQWERLAFERGGADYRAPAQRVGDFLKGRPSKRLGRVRPSYQPGVLPGDLSVCLPDYCVAAIREALPVFDRQIRGFAMPDAVLTGVETRTSSPVRIRRGDDLQSVNTIGLYPAGEGAGYAGGIVSSAVDGIRAAEAVAADIVKRHTSGAFS